MNAVVEMMTSTSSGVLAQSTEFVMGVGPQLLLAAGTLAALALGLKYVKDIIENGASGPIRDYKGTQESWDDPYSSQFDSIVDLDLDVEDGTGFDRQAYFADEPEEYDDEVIEGHGVEGSGVVDDS